MLTIVQSLAAVCNVSNSFSKHYTAGKGCIALSPTTSLRQQNDDITDSVSSESESPRLPSVPPEPNSTIPPTNELEHQSNTSHSGGSGDSLRREILQGRSRASNTQAVIVVGPPGYTQPITLLFLCSHPIQRWKEFPRSCQSSDVAQYALFSTLRPAFLTMHHSPWTMGTGKIPRCRFCTFCGPRECPICIALNFHVTLNFYR